MTKIFSIPTIIALSTLAINANASDGTLSFNGNVISSTCSIGGSGSNATVNLPSVRTTELNAAGKTAGTTAFAISLEDCSSEVESSAYVYFETDSGVTSEGRLSNLASDGAKNVELQITTDAGIPVKLGDPSQEDDNNTVDISSGTAQFNYQVRYYATGVATEGAISSQIMYTISYK